MIRIEEFTTEQLINGDHFCDLLETENKAVAEFRMFNIEGDNCNHDLLCETPKQRGGTVHNFTAATTLDPAEKRSRRVEAVKRFYSMYSAAQLLSDADLLGLEERNC